MARTRKINASQEDFDLEMKTWDDARNKAEISTALTKKINLQPRTKKQSLVIDTIRENEISIVTGPPGTGKTYISCAMALNYIKEESAKYKNIILIKSVNVPKDEEIGYLKGTLEEKMEMYMYPFISNFSKIIGKDQTKCLKDKGVIEILPIKFALGVTLDNCIVIIDEFQQVSKDSLRTLITRIGTNCKMIFLGDVKQKSVNQNKKSALEILTEHFVEVPGIGAVELTNVDVVRNPIIKKILKIFDDIEKDEKLNGC